MSKKNKKKSSPGQNDELMPGARVIHHVGGSYIEGNVSVTGGGDFVGRDRINVDASQHTISTVFQTFYSQVDNHPLLPEEKKAEIKAEIKALEAEAQKGEDAEKSFLEQRLHNLKAMSKDIWEVIVTTMANPATGFSMVASKIAQRASESAQNKA